MSYSPTDPILSSLETLKVCAALEALGAAEREARYEASEAQIAEVADAPREQVEQALVSLEQRGYATRFREYRNGAGEYTMWASLTEAGSRALASHLERLREIAAAG